MNALLETLNSYIWSIEVVMVVFAAGVLFTIWSVFSQYRALTHGVAVVAGKYSNTGGEGAISHFQALSAALSATVGLGNIAGVAIAVMLGGPGAVLWMWIVGLLGMAIKSTEVTLSMMYRNTDDPDNPHGGPMWVAKRALAEWGQGFKVIGMIIAIVFCIAAILGALTAGNVFQAFSVADVAVDRLNLFFTLPETTQIAGVAVDPTRWAVGGIMAVLVGLVIIGGIKRIGSVAGFLVPFMCGIYVITGLTIIGLNIEQVPALFALIWSSAFGAEAQGAFLGGSFAAVFIFGMKRALFSSEAGFGSSPMAHAAARTREPAREGIVAGLEPFIDTVVVCTITALVLLLAGTWNRAPDFVPPATNEIQISQTQQMVDEQPVTGWTLADIRLPAGEWNNGDTAYVIVEATTKTDDLDENNQPVLDSGLMEWTGSVTLQNFGRQTVPVAGEWTLLPLTEYPETPVLVSAGLYKEVVGAQATSLAFDAQLPGFGGWMVSIAVLLFALSTIISWSYYGEQGVAFIVGKRLMKPFVLIYRLIYCAIIFVSCAFLDPSNKELDNISTFAVGLMLVINIPLILALGYKAMNTYHDYVSRLKAGQVD